MNRTPPAPVVVKGLAALALALGLAATACGPQQKFCPDSGDNGVCQAPIDAPVKSDVMDTAPQDKHSIFIGQDDAADADAPVDAAVADTGGN